jgi:outer membrane lipoprotein-sorting protein
LEINHLGNGSDIRISPAAALLPSGIKEFMSGHELGTMRFLPTLPLILCLSFPIGASAQQTSESRLPNHNAPLTLDQILSNLELRNAQRAAALEQFEGKRVYRMQYHGFPGDKEAQMVVKMSFRAPDSKQFTVVSESGSKFVIDHVLKKLLDSETEAIKGEGRQSMALTRDNYDFQLAGYEASPGGGQYVLKLLPKTKNKYLYRGTIWVDAKDFAVSRIEGEPGKNPSMWIKKTDIAHRYMKVDDFWLPAENRTESATRLGGKAILSIEYQDYRIIKASPSKAAKIVRQRDAIVGSSVEDSAIWINRLAVRGSH